MEAFNTRYDEVRAMVIELAMESVRDNTPIHLRSYLGTRPRASSSITIANGITIPYIYEVDKNHRKQDYMQQWADPDDNTYSVYTQVLSQG